MRKQGNWAPRAVPVVVGVSLVVAIWASSAQEPAADQGDSRSGGAVASRGVGGLEITAAVARTDLNVGERAPFWLTFDNRGRESIRNLGLLPLAETSYSLVSRCWCPTAPGSCVPQAARAAGSGSCETILAELSPGQTITVWGELQAVRARERAALHLVLAWQDPAGRPSQRAVRLGDTSVSGPLQTVAWFLDGVWKFIQVVLLPVVLAWLAYYFQKRQAERDARDRQEAEHQGRIKETWSLMLRTSHQMATRHYLPIGGACIETVKWVRRQALLAGHRLPPGPQKELESTALRAFAQFLQFERLSRRLYREAGGFSLFRDLQAEHVAMWAHQYPRNVLFWNDAALCAHVNLLMRYIKPADTWDLILEKGRDPAAAPSFKAFWDVFRAWQNTPECEECLISWEVFAHVLYQETNRPFKYWYEGSRPKDFPEELGAKLEAVLAARKKRAPASDELKILEILARDFKQYVECLRNLPRTEANRRQHNAEAKQDRA